MLILLLEYLCNLMSAFLLLLLFHKTSLEELTTNVHKYILLCQFTAEVRSRHQISFLNLAKAFNFLIFCVAKVNFGYELFESRNRLAFDDGRLLAVTKWHRSISSSTSSVQKLQLLQLRIWEGPSLASLWFWNSKTKVVSNPAA